MPHFHLLWIRKLIDNLRYCHCTLDHLLKRYKRLVVSENSVSLEYAFTDSGLFHFKSFEIKFWPSVYIKILWMINNENVIHLGSLWNSSNSVLFYQKLVKMQNLKTVLSTLEFSYVMSTLEFSYVRSEPIHYWLKENWDCWDPVDSETQQLHGPSQKIFTAESRA